MAQEAGKTGKSARDIRKERLASRLRDNLKRRKLQARARAEKDGKKERL